LYEYFLGLKSINTVIVNTSEIQRLNKKFKNVIRFPECRIPSCVVDLTDRSDQTCHEVMNFLYKSHKTIHRLQKKFKEKPHKICIFTQHTRISGSFKLPWPLDVTSYCLHDPLFIFLHLPSGTMPMVTN